MYRHDYNRDLHIAHSVRMMTFFLLRQYAQHSYTDDDIDCLVPRRAIYHFAGNARYLWTHAVRPSVSAGDGTDVTFERWGTWDKVLRREKMLGQQ